MPAPPSDNDWSAWEEVQVERDEEHLLHEPLTRQSTALTTDASVPGRLQGHEEVYSRLGAEPYIVALVRDGYRLEFDSLPPPSCTPNNRSARDNIGFVKTELRRLEHIGCIQRVREPPTLVLPLSLVYSNKWRLVLDASRGLNPYCTARGVKLDDHSSIPATVKPHSYMVVNDLDSGFWHIRIHPDHWQYLGISVEGEDGEPEYYVWKVLVLGLRDAVHVFTRTIAPIMSQLRREGISSQIYVDDALVCNSTKELTLKDEARMIELFSEAGWVFKPSKRSGEPSQICRFLGLEINSTDYTFNIPEDKLLTIESRLQEVKSRRRLKIRMVARLVGTLQAVRRATGPIVSVMTRSLYEVVHRATSWHSWTELDAMARYEVDWWLHNIRDVAKYPINGSLSTTPVSYEVASDASGVGHYCYLVGSQQTVLSARAFSVQEQEESSTWRELTAFHDTWTNEEVLRQFAGTSVAHYTDSQAMATIIRKGSRNPKLQPMVMRAVLSLRKHGINMEAGWRSREEGLIIHADRGSRDYHSDDISLDHQSMTEINLAFGQCDIDTFASAANRKANRFFSRLDVPNTSGVDFFHQQLLPSDSHFCFPHPSFLVAALRHFEKFACSAVMVVPVWPNSAWYTVFWPDGRHAAPFITKMILIRPYFICGPLVTSTGMRGLKSYLTAVVLVDFRAARQGASGGSGGGRCLQGGCAKCISA